jgi:hypothetical protein
LTEFDEIAGVVKQATPCSTEANDAWMSPETAITLPPPVAASFSSMARLRFGKPSH